MCAGRDPPNATQEAGIMSLPLLPCPALDCSFLAVK